jgi:hypothetical protein
MSYLYYLGDGCLIGGSFWGLGGICRVIVVGKVDGHEVRSL